MKEEELAVIKAFIKSLGGHLEPAIQAIRRLGSLTLAEAIAFMPGPAKREPDSGPGACLALRGAEDVIRLQNALRNSGELRTGIGKHNENAQAKLNSICDRAANLEFLSPGQEEATEDAANKIRKIAEELLRFLYLIRNASFAPALEQAVDRFLQPLHIEKLAIPLAGGVDLWFDLNLPDRTILIKETTNPAILGDLHSIYQQPRLLRFVNRLGEKTECYFGGSCVMYKCKTEDLEPGR